MLKSLQSHLRSVRWRFWLLLAGAVMAYGLATAGADAVRTTWQDWTLLHDVQQRVGDRPAVKQHIQEMEHHIHTLRAAGSDSLRRATPTSALGVVQAARPDALTLVTVTPGPVQRSRAYDEEPLQMTVRGPFAAVLDFAHTLETSHPQVHIDEATLRRTESSVQAEFTARIVRFPSSR